MHADKRSLIVQLGLNIPIRDMRLLDFNLLSSGACEEGEAGAAATQRVFARALLCEQSSCVPAGLLLEPALLRCVR